jgi:nucleotide-binding universal stress UspA family protein
MAPRIIVSYDGTANDRDALALGELLARSGATLDLAYVRHSEESETARERLAEAEARTLLATAAEELGGGVSTHVVLSGSTPDGLRGLAVETGADMIVFGSDYRTAPGHVDPQSSARRLIDGGPVAIGLAPAAFGNGTPPSVATVGAVGEDGDPCVRETADAIAGKLSASVAERASSDIDLLVVGSKSGTVTGRITISAAADYLIELARCPVIILPRGVAVAF